MFDRKDDSGQVLLTSAILFAIIIIIIALMLNNIIYATNVAYIGFIDGSKYEDLSIRQLTTKEATGSYQNSPDDNTRSQYMSDYEKAINYLTNSKGKYVDLINTYYTSSPLGLTVTQTKWDLVIANKGSSVKYAINTGSTDPTATSPPSVPSEPTVSFSSDLYEVNEGGACTVTVELNHASDNDITITYATIQDDTAIDGTNYIGVSDSLTIHSGELFGTFSITTLHDGAYMGGALAFTIDIIGVTNAVEGSPASATISITDIDPDPSGNPTQSGPAMRVDCTPVRQSTGDKKEVTITSVVTNTGDVYLTNVVLIIGSPTDKTFVSGGSPQTIGTLAPGDSCTIVWVITTQNVNDRVTVWVEATSIEVPIATSDTWADV